MGCDGADAAGGFFDVGNIVVCDVIVVEDVDTVFQTGFPVVVSSDGDCDDSRSGVKCP